MSDYVICNGRRTGRSLQLARALCTVADMNPGCHIDLIASIYQRERFTQRLIDFNPSHIYRVTSSLVEFANGSRIYIIGIPRESPTTRFVGVDDADLRDMDKIRRYYSNAKFYLVTEKKENNDASEFERFGDGGGS
jgi:hypothetical protein